MSDRVALRPAVQRFFGRTIKPRSKRNIFGVTLTDKVENVIANGQFFLFGKGAEYGDWIDYDNDGNARTSGKTSGNLIENPAGIIEYIAREAGLKEDQLDYSAFDSAISAGSWVNAGVYDVQQNWLGFTSEVARFFGAILYFNRDNQLTIVPYDAGSNFKVSGTDVPDTKDIFNAEDIAVSTSSSLSSDYKFDNHPILEGGISIEYEPKANIVNEVYIQYQKNYAKNEYLKTAYVKADKSDDGTGTQDQSGSTGDDNREARAQNSQDLYGQTGTLKLECPMIIDDATAVLLRNHIFDRRYVPRMVCTFRTWFNAYDINIGDIINIRHPIIQNTVSARYIINSSNHNLKITEATGSLTFTVTIPSNVYKGSELADAIKAELDANSPNGWTYLVSFSGNTFTIASGGGNIFLHQNTVPPSDNIAEYIGFNSNAGSAASISSDVETYQQRKWYVRRRDFDPGLREMEIEAIELI